MNLVNIGGHTAYQNRVLTQLRKYYPDAINSLSSSTWQILDKQRNLDFSKIDSLMNFTSTLGLLKYVIFSNFILAISILDNIYFSKFIQPMNLVDKLKIPRAYSFV